MIEWTKISSTNTKTLPPDDEVVLLSVCFVVNGEFDFDVVVGNYDPDGDYFNLTIEDGAIYNEDDCVVIAWAKKPEPYKFAL